MFDKFVTFRNRKHVYIIESNNRYDNNDVINIKTSKGKIKQVQIIKLVDIKQFNNNDIYYYSFKSVNCKINIDNIKNVKYKLGYYQSLQYLKNEIDIKNDKLLNCQDKDDIKEIKKQLKQLKIDIEIANMLYSESELTDNYRLITALDLEKFKKKCNKDVTDLIKRYNDYIVKNMITDIEMIKLHFKDLNYINSIIQRMFYIKSFEKLKYKKILDSLTLSMLEYTSYGTWEVVESKSAVIDAYK